MGRRGPCPDHGRAGRELQHPGRPRSRSPVHDLSARGRRADVCRPVAGHEDRGAAVRDDREIRVAERPERPLLVFDGDCGFCRQWVGRWRGITGERVEYRPSQEVAERFPEIGEERFKAEGLADRAGRAGPRAARGRCSGCTPWRGTKRWPSWMYEELPTFAAVAEAAYAIVARHRGAAAVATRLLWGSVVERPRYRRMQAIFLRGLGVVYLAAFWSLAVQVDGLIGSRGILPAGEFLRTIGPALGEHRVLAAPDLALARLLRSGLARPLLGRGGRERPASWRGSFPGLPGAALDGVPVADGGGATVPGISVGRAPAGGGPAGNPLRALECLDRVGPVGAVEGPLRAASPPCR